MEANHISPKAFQAANPKMDDINKAGAVLKTKMTQRRTSGTR